MSDYAQIDELKYDDGRAFESDSFRDEIVTEKNGDAHLFRDLLSVIDFSMPADEDVPISQDDDCLFVSIHQLIWEYITTNYASYDVEYFTTICKRALGHFYISGDFSKLVMAHIFVISPSTVLSQLKKFVVESMTFHELILYAEWCLRDTIDVCPLYREYVSRVFSRMYKCSEDRLSTWLHELTNTECLLAGLLIRRKPHETKTLYREDTNANVYDYLYRECFDFSAYREPIQTEVNELVNFFLREYVLPTQSFESGVPITITENSFNVAPIRVDTFATQSRLLNRMFWLWNGASYHASDGNFVYDPKGFLNKLKTWSLYDVMKRSKKSVKLEDAMNLAAMRAVCDTSNVNASNSGSRLLKSGHSYGDLASTKPYSRWYVSYTEVGVRSTDDCGSFVIGNLFLNNFEIRTPATVSTLTFDYQRIGIPRNDRFCTFVTKRRFVSEYVANAMFHLTTFRDMICYEDALALITRSPIIADKTAPPDEIPCGDDGEFAGGMILDYIEVIRLSHNFLAHDFEFFCNLYIQDKSYRRVVLLIARLVEKIDPEIVKLYIDNGRLVEFIREFFRPSLLASTDGCDGGVGDDDLRRAAELRRYNAARCNNYSFDRKQRMEAIRKRKWTDEEVEMNSIPRGFAESLKIYLELEKKYLPQNPRLLPPEAPLPATVKPTTKVVLTKFRDRSENDVTLFRESVSSSQVKYIVERTVSSLLENDDWRKDDTRLTLQPNDAPILARCFALYVIFSRGKLIPNFEFRSLTKTPRYIIMRRIDSYASAYESWLTSCLSRTSSGLNLVQRTPSDLRHSVCNALTSLYLFCDNSLASLAYFCNVLHSVKFPGQNDRTVYLLRGSSSSGKSCLIEKIRDYYNSEFGVVNEQALRNQTNETNTSLVPLASNFCCQLDEIQEMAAKRMKSVVSESKQYYRVFHEQEPRVMSMMASLFITVNDMFTIDSDDGVVTRLRFIMPLYHHYYDCVQRMVDTAKYNTGLAAVNVSYQFLTRTYPKGLNWDTFIRGCFYVFEYFCRYSVRDINDRYFASVDRHSEARRNFVRVAYQSSDSFGGNGPVPLEPQPTMFNDAKNDTLLKIDSFKRFLKLFTVVRGDRAWNDDRLFVWFEENYAKFSVRSARPTKLDIHVIVDRFKTEFRCFRDDRCGGYVVEIVEK